LLLFMVVPLAELYVLLKFANLTSIPATFALVLLTGVTGSLLAARQGRAAIRNFQNALASGRMPGPEAVDGILIVFAAALLLTPGLLTDITGIFLLIPWSRAVIRNFLIRRYAGRFKVVTLKSGTPFGSDDDGTTVDATFRRTEQEPIKPTSLPPH
jgi:UPF0716 protein FxsA